MATADFETQRKNMVESQVRPSDVTDRRITAAMSAVPRERFVPADLAPLAYMDGAVLEHGGRGLMPARDFARLLQLADVQDTDKLLIAGSWRGYSAAIAARLASEVFALEQDEAAAAFARDALAALGIANVKVVSGALAAGWSAAAPYDVIVIEGSIGSSVPEALLAQLDRNGRLVVVERGCGVARAVLVTTTNGVPARRIAFEAAAPALPGFDRPAQFVF